MILTPQLPASMWHKQIGDPALAGGILPRIVRHLKTGRRIVHNPHRIEMRGDSMRKTRGRQTKR